MSRSDVERELLQQEFPAFTEDIASAAAEARNDIDVTYYESRVATCITDAHQSLMIHWYRASGGAGIALTAFELATKYIQKAIAFQNELMHMSNEDLRVLLDKLHADKKDARRQRASEIDMFAWFNNQECALQTSFWKNISSFTPDEVVAITLGKDPRRVDLKKLQSWKYYFESAFASVYNDRLCLMEVLISEKDALRALVNGKLKKKDVDLWLLSHQLGSLFDSEPMNQDSDVDDDSLETKAKNSLYRIILGLIFSSKKIDKNAPLRDWLDHLTIELEADLRVAGMSLNQKTIKKHVRAAHEYARACDPPLIKVRSS